MRDGILRDVHTERVNAAITQTLNQKPEGAANIENRPWLEATNDIVRDIVEKRKPMLGAPVCFTIVIVVV